MVTWVGLLLLSWHSGMVIGVSLFLLDEEQLMINWFAKKRSPRQVVFDQLNGLFWRLSSYHSDITMSFPRRVEILLFSFWYCLTCSFIALSIKLFWQDYFIAHAVEPCCIISGGLQPWLPHFKWWVPIVTADPFIVKFPVRLSSNGFIHWKSLLETIILLRIQK